ncbi:MAG TPA: FMN-dependent NADH-azoreductase [Bacteroidetes bacterium]|nr:FMN-dependent NADH-azoreductase [Bacteroidota bacterium]
MKKLLRIDASSRQKDSRSREVADYFQKKWEAGNPAGTVVLRDLVLSPLPHIKDATIQGFYTPTENFTPELVEATALSDQVINEMKSADDILISTPLYNFSIPSALKAYIDHLSRINKTFGMDAEGNFFGMLKNKKTYIVTSKGAVYKGTPIEALDMQEPYLKLILPFLGLEIADIFSVEGTTTDESIFNKSKTNALKRIEQIFN